MSSVTPGNGGGAAGSGKGGGPTIVLDLPELDRLSKAYQNASDALGTSGVRSKLQTLQAELEQPLAALSDRTLATNITKQLSFLTAMHQGFDSNARQMADISYYTGEIRRLALQADANGDGTYSPGEIDKFLGTDPTHQDHSAWAAVVEALEGGVIRTTPPKSKAGDTKKDAKPKDAKPKDAKPKGAKPKGAPGSGVQVTGSGSGTGGKGHPKPHATTQ